MVVAPRARRALALLGAACAALSLMLASIRPLLAQASTGSVQGVVYDSLTSRPLAGAMVEVSGTTQMVTTDKQGRFRIDSLSPGSHRVSFSAIELDSIGLFGFAREVQVRANATERVTLATPSFRTMYAQLCAPIEKPVRDSAIVFGTVTNAATGARVDSARVQFSWFGVVTDKRGVRMEETAREARSGSNGDYGICGLPSDLSLTTRALTKDAASGIVQTSIGDARIVRVDLAVSAELHAAEVAHRQSADSLPVRAHGSSTVRGIVKDERGRPLVNALVVLAAADTAVRTDAGGRFQIGNAPAGTQQIEVRQLGLGAVSRVVQLESNKTFEVDFTLSPATVLSTVNVRGNRVGFDQNSYLTRKKVGFGRFVESAELVKRADLVGALRYVPGLMVELNGFDFNLFTTRRKPLGGRCSPTIVIDGVPEMRMTNGSTIPLDGSPPPPPTAPSMLTTLNLRDVVAIEFYASQAGIPLQYSMQGGFDCGMLLVWTKAARW